MHICKEYHISNLKGMNEINAKGTLSICISLTYKDQLMTLSFNKTKVIQLSKYEKFILIISPMKKIGVDFLL